MLARVAFRYYASGFTDNCVALIERKVCDEAQVLLDVTGVG